MKLRCKMFGHRWRWFHLWVLVPHRQELYIRVCSRCAKVQLWRWYDTCYIWSDPIELTGTGFNESIGSKAATLD